MRSLLFLSVFAFAASVSAQERVPDFQDPHHVPDPIPSDICIEVHWTEKSGPWKRGKHWSIFHPPLDAETLRLMSEAREKGLGKLVRCSVSAS